MNKVRLEILGLSYSNTQSGAYALVLAEKNGKRRIPIIIGSAEAQSIAIQLERLVTPRPLTHDLFINMADEFGITVSEINIFKLEEGIFYSELICKNEDKTARIDARTSDAVALALRFHCPIYTSEEILEKAGIILDFEDSSNPSSKSKSTEKDDSEYDSYSEEELKQILGKAIEVEDYEKASISNKF